MNAMTNIIAASPPYRDALTALHIARGVEEMFSITTWTPAYLASEARGPRIAENVTAEMDRLVEGRCDAENAWIAIPAPDVAAVLFKVEYARVRWADMEDWPPAWWTAVIADLRRLASDPHMAWLAERDALLREANRTNGVSDEDAEPLIDQATAIEQRIRATPAAGRDGVLAKALLVVAEASAGLDVPAQLVFAEAKVLGFMEFEA